MYQRILVPLDGSDLAEAALPCAEGMARKLGSRLILLNVCGQSERHRDIYQDYLDMLSRKIGERINGEVEAITLVGKAAEEIIDYIENNDISVTVMATHGRSGIGRWVLGSVADRVVRGTHRPIILIRAEDAHGVVADKGMLDRILVPLDGSELGEAALPYVEDLATKVGSEVILFRVVEEEYHFAVFGEAYAQIPYTEEEMEPIRVEARRYLEKVLGRLKKKGITVSSEMREGNPAEKIIAFAEEADVDMVAMSTHGRSGIGRWVYGSIASKVVHSGSTKVMLVRAPGAS